MMRPAVVSVRAKHERERACSFATRGASRRCAPVYESVRVVLLPGRIGIRARSADEGAWSVPRVVHQPAHLRLERPDVRALVP